MNRAVVICGTIARRPDAGGHAWALLQYVLGFRRLGWDVTFVDQVDGACTTGVAWTVGVLERFGVGDRYAVLGEDGASVAGLTRSAVQARTKRSAALINVMGYLRDEDVLGSAPLRVFLDIDPGYGQIWRELGLADVLAGHEAHVTVARRIGRDGCEVPTCGLEWITTAPPIVLEHWPQVDVADGAFTSVATWRGPYGPLDYRGRTYGSRVHEFRRFVPLPRLTRARFELALDVDPADHDDVTALSESGWDLVQPRSVAGDPWAYRTYIQGSRAEICVAKGMYTQTRGGWFSDRSSCYLASGKPVVAQDTGFGDDLPVGEGLLAFATLEEAAAAVEEVERDHARHAAAARAIAETHLDSDIVLRTLIDNLGLT